MATHAMDSPKGCEHHPLLRVCGAGDGGRPPSVVTALPKRSRFDRWPEIMSACWMTIVLLCICFLTLYVLGMALTKRQGLMVQYIKARESQYQYSDSVKNVYYHHIVERGMPVDFITFSKYLAKMAVLYQNLRFNVFFLTSDPVRRMSVRPKHGRLAQLFASTLTSNLSPRLSEENAQELRIFLREHRNVNVTVMPIDKYLASTSLKDKWKGLPSTWIAFYARVISVWRYGGIGIDLATANAEHLMRYKPDPRKTAVFKEHNDGDHDSVHIDTARDMIQRMQNEELPILLYLFKFMSEFFDQSIQLFGNNSWITVVDKNKYQNEEVVSKTPINKATVSSVINSPSKRSELNNTIIKHTFKIQSNNSDTFSSAKTITNVNIDAKDVEKLTPDATFKETNAIPTSGTARRQNQTEFMPSGEYEMLPPIFLYRFFLTSNDVQPDYKSKADSKCHRKNNHYPNVIKTKGIYRKCALTLDLNGNFVSSFSRFHPLLYHIIYANFRPMSPRSAVEDALMAHCSTSDSIENYCRYINII